MKQSHRAFTLIELVVVLGVVALLAAILLPALAGVRRAAGRSASSSNLRNISMLIEQYASNHDLAYPFPDESRSYPLGCRGVSIQFGHWSAATNWPMIVGATISWEQFVGIMHSPGAARSIEQPNCGHPTSYEFSHSFIARPELWSVSTPTLGALLRPTRTSEVRHPSRKVLMWDREATFLHQPIERSGADIAESVPMLFADGHVESQAPSQASEPVENPYLRGTDRGNQRLHNTRDGVLGWDY